MGFSVRTATSRESKNKASAPLVSWAYGGALSACITAIIFSVMSAGAPASTEFTRHNILRLESAFENNNRAQQKVILLGDSRIRYATPDDETLSAMMSNALGSPVAAITISNNWAVFPDFKDLLGVIETLGVDLVVMQAELFERERASASSFLLGREYLIWQLFRNGPWNPGNVDHAHLQSDRDCGSLAVETIKQRKMRVGAWVKMEKTGPNADAAKSFVNSSSNFEIVNISIPSTSSARSELTAFMASAQSNALRFPDVLADEWFCDAVHMDKNARDLYAVWLSKTIAGRLGKA